MGGVAASERGGLGFNPSPGSSHSPRTRAPGRPDAEYRLNWFSLASVLVYKSVVVVVKLRAPGLMAQYCQSCETPRLNYHPCVNWVDPACWSLEPADRS